MRALERLAVVLSLVIHIATHDGCATAASPRALRQDTPDDGLCGPQQATPHRFCLPKNLMIFVFAVFVSSDLFAYAACCPLRTRVCDVCRHLYRPSGRVAGTPGFDCGPNRDESHVENRWKQVITRAAKRWIVCQQGVHTFLHFIWQCYLQLPGWCATPASQSAEQ